MRSYMFITNEGFTQDCNHKEIPNMQLLGVADGKDVNEAFYYFKQEHDYLKNFAFKDVIALEYVGDFIRNLEL